MNIVFEDGSSPPTYYYEDKMGKKQQEFNEFFIFEDDEDDGGEGDGEGDGAITSSKKKKNRQVRPIDSEKSQPLYAFIDTSTRLKSSRKSVSEELIDKDLENIVNSRPGMVIISSWEG